MVVREYQASKKQQKNPVLDEFIKTHKFKNCHSDQEDFTLYLEVKDNDLMVGFKKGDIENECYKIKLPPHYFSEDHDSYIFMSAYSGSGIANKHVIHKARFIDSKHLHDRVEIDSE